MKVTVISINPRDVKKVKKGLSRLRKCLKIFCRDLDDRRVDAESIQSLVDGLRLTADYFEKLLEG